MLVDLLFLLLLISQRAIIFGEGYSTLLAPIRFHSKRSDAKSCSHLKKNTARLPTALFYWNVLYTLALACNESSKRTKPSPNDNAVVRKGKKLVSASTVLLQFVLFLKA